MHSADPANDWLFSRLGAPSPQAAAKPRDVTAPSGFDAATDHNRRAVRLAGQGAHSQALGRHDEAIQDYTEVVRLRPDLPAAHHGRGLAYAALGDHGRALADFSRAIDIDPRYAQAFLSRGLTRLAAGQYEEALVDQLEAIRLDSRSAHTYQTFARFWLSDGDPELRNPSVARDLAWRACELTEWSDWSCVALLAGCCAAARSWAEALAYARRTVTLAPDAGRPICLVRVEEYLQAAGPRLC